jgi:hypothetical protein
MRGKRDVEVLRRLLAKYGDMKLSEVVARLSEKPKGRPTEWTLDVLVELYLTIEAAKAESKSMRASCAEVAERTGLSAKTIEKHYAEAQRRFDRIAKPYMTEILARRLPPKES